MELLYSNSMMFKRDVFIQTQLYSSLVPKLFEKVSSALSWQVFNKKNIIVDLYNNKSRQYSRLIMYIVYILHISTLTIGCYSANGVLSTFCMAVIPPIVHLCLDRYPILAFIVVTVSICP